MTELNEAIEVAETPEVETVETHEVDTNEVQADNDAQEETETQEGGETPNGDEWPKKAVNALSREKKNNSKLRARMQELEVKLADLNNAEVDSKPVNADDYETMDEYIRAQTDSMVEQKLKNNTSEQTKAQLTQEQETLLAERNQSVAMQAQETAKYIPDFQAVIGQHTQTLDSMPDVISDIFYSIDNAPLAAYVLAKEGKLNALAYSNPHVAANEIIQAQQRGEAMMHKPRTHVSQAPEPMRAANGRGTINKDISQGDVLKNLGLK